METFSREIFGLQGGNPPSTQQIILTSIEFIQK
jgi:hypothetical protein